MSGVWQLSNKRMTVKVSTDAAGKIRTAAPIVRRFVGQALDNLKRWMSGIGPTEVTLLR